MRTLIRNSIGVIVLGLTAPALAAQAGGHAHDPAAHGRHHPAARAATSDSAFAGVQARGAQVMGVDQAASVHRFEPLADGGRIVFTMRDTTDADGTAAIRAHLQAITVAFAAGDFSQPFGVHAQAVPGTAVMAHERAALRYWMTPVAGGGAVRITATTPTALAAVHEFLAFQRADHRVP